jgi:hypothetical protein
VQGRDDAKLPDQARSRDEPDLKSSETLINAPKPPSFCGWPRMF